MNRVFDVLIALVLLAVLAIPLLLISLLIKLTSKGPVIHATNRIGVNNSLFKMYKFRTMRMGVPQLATHLLENRDQYMTPIGRYLRAMAVDEWPQLFNILKGNMTFIGPRPALYNQYDLIKLRTKEGVHALKPGLAGWAQVNGSTDVSIPLKVQYDKYYLKNKSFLMNVKITLRALSIVLRSVMHEVLGSMVKFGSKGFLSKLFHPTRFKRIVFFLLADSAIIVGSLYLAFLVRFDFNYRFFDDYKSVAFYFLAVFLIVKLCLLGACGVYQFTWRYVSLRELIKIGKVILLSGLLLIGFIYYLPGSAILSFSDPEFIGFPRSIIPIDGFMSLILFSGLRISKRFYLEMVSKNSVWREGQNTIIIGANDVSETLVRNILKQHSSDYNIKGFLDDDAFKTGTYVHGIKVWGGIDKLAAIISKHAIEVVIIAVPSLDNKRLREIYATARDAGIQKIKIVPRAHDLSQAQINVNSFENIKIEDLLGRQAVDLNYKDIEDFLIGRTVLVTGAGGSIGSEIVTQVCSFCPAKIILLDIDETAIHNMDLKLKKLYPHLDKRMVFVVADIKDGEGVKNLFETYRPDVVFHAAAYKHVPMMELHPVEAVKVNVFGAYNVAMAAKDYGSKKFIMISSDKAVRPTSIMGATKQMAENICRAFNGGTEFISVRFGNVLGSRGSVLPLFLDQLANGGPLTITHKDMQRYFMTIPEAVSLVLQASAAGGGGDVMVLDMGQPLKIVRIAEEIIRFHGLEPYKDINIKFIGLRPGEKLFEELLTAEEEREASCHEKIFKARTKDKYSLDDIENVLARFKEVIYASNGLENNRIKELLKQHVRWHDG